MTTVIYNGVILRDCETKSFNQTTEYDPSNTDMIHTKFRISVASTLVATSYPGTVSFGISPPEDGSPSSAVTTRAKDIFSRLSEPRKDFHMLIEGSVSNEKTGAGGAAGSTIALLIATGQFEEGLYFGAVGTVGYISTNPLDGSAAVVLRDTVIDVDNGPKPQNVRITEIIGGRSLRVEFEIEISRKICIPGFVDVEPVTPGGVITADNRIISNRWSLDESKDENWITTKRISGELRVVHTSYWPHAMRLLCVPTLLQGYKRIRQNFTDDPSGLKLKYTIEDQQAHASPPWPAVSWKGHHAETMSGPNGSIFGGEFHIRLTGVPNVDKTLLIGAAGKVAVDRLRGLVPPYDSNGKRTNFSTILQNASIVNQLDSPTIEMRVQVKYTDKDAAKALAMRVAQMGRPLTTLTGTDPYEVEGYDPRVWPVPLPYDSTSPAGIFSCYLQSPCSVWHDMPGGLPPGGDGITPPERKAVSSSGDPDEPETGSDGGFEIPDDEESELKTYDEIYDFPYTFVDLESRYEFSNGWVQLPLATTDSGATTAALIKLHGNTAKRIIYMTTTREGKMPMIPALTEDSYDHNGIREVLQKWWISGKAPSLLAGGQGRQFSIQTQYVYLLARAPTATEKLRLGSTQIDKVLPADNWMNLAEMEDSGGAMQTINGAP
ncbi:MAG: hypothetical protein ACO1RT_17585 [Planctomycetaceae bacterium]